MPSRLHHHQNSRKKDLTSVTHGAANERNYNALISVAEDLSEILGNKRSDIFTYEIGHKEHTTDLKPEIGILDRIGTKLFAAIPMDHLEQSPIMLSPTIIEGAVKKYTTAIPGVTFTSDIDMIERNNAIAAYSDPGLRHIVENNRASRQPKLYILADMLYPAARKVRETEHKILVELYTICAVQREILKYVHNARELTVPKTRAYANITKGIVPHAMDHNLSFSNMTEANINDPEWVAAQRARLGTNMTRLKNRYIAPDRIQHADKIAKTFSVTIARRHMRNLANG